MPLFIPRLIETLDYLLRPESRVTGNATRVAQTTFDGASFVLDREVIVSRLLFRTTGATATGTVRILLYQARLGQSRSSANLVSRIATITGFDPPDGTTSNNLATFAEGRVRFSPGIVYVLFGRDSAGGSVTMRTYTTQPNDLLVQNVDLATHPTTFDTAIASNTSPATLDPRQAPTGQLSGTLSDVTPTVRLVV